MLEKSKQTKEKKENGKGQKPYKNSVFFKVVIQKCEK